MRRTLTIALVLLAGSAHASPVDLFGFGARGQGLAGAITATARGFESVYYNPSGLAFDLDPSFAIGYQLGTFDLVLNDHDYDAIDAPALSLGFGVPIPFGGILRHRVSLGLGFVIPQTSILIADIAQPGDPSFVVVENRAQTVSVQAAIGFRLHDGLALGIGTIALAELDGEIAVAPNAAGRLGSRVKDELRADFALVTGVTLKPLAFDDCPDNDERLALALTYRGESRADFSLPITADLGDSFGIPIPKLNVRGTAQYDPAEATFEVSGRPLPWLMVAGGVTYEWWSTFPQPIAYSAVPDGTPPEPLPDFHDTVSFKIGVEAPLKLSELVTLTGRAGFAYEPTPTPNQTGFHNHLDGDRTIVALGFGATIGSFRVDLAGQWHALAERTSTKKDDTAPTNPGFPSITSSGDIFFFAVEVGITL